MSKWYSTLIQLMTVNDPREAPDRFLAPNKDKTPRSTVDRNQHPQSGPPGYEIQSVSEPELGSWISDFLEFYRERFGEVLVLDENGPLRSSLNRTPELQHTPKAVDQIGVAEARSSALIREPAFSQMVNKRPIVATPHLPARNTRMPHHRRTGFTARVLSGIRRLLTCFGRPYPANKCSANSVVSSLPPRFP